LILNKTASIVVVEFSCFFPTCKICSFFLLLSMHIKFVYVFYVLMSCLLLSCRASRQDNNPDMRRLAAAHWESRRIDSSVIWLHAAFQRLFDTIENINVLDIDLHDPAVRPALIYQSSLLSRTHEMAVRENAIGAVNGNFFHMKEGGSVCFLKVDGKVIDTSRTDLGEKIFLDELDDAALTIDSSGGVAIRLCPAEGWQSLSGIPTILSGGPPLLIRGKTIPLIRHSFNDRRYARTGLGITLSGHLLLVTVDGHSDKSAGVSIDQFRNVFRYFHCSDAMNLDGGGSTTMYIRGQPYDGIVNYPTDNKKYDHTGERKVANILAVIRRQGR
jgi:exopolysaccharide biosynthesis protein